MAGIDEFQQRFEEATTQPWGLLLPWSKLEAVIKLYAQKENIESDDNWEAAGAQYLTATHCSTPFSDLLKQLLRIKESQPQAGLIGITIDFAAQKGIRWLNQARPTPLTPGAFQIAANISRHIVFGQIDVESFLRDLIVNWVVDRAQGPASWLFMDNGRWVEKDKDGKSLPQQVIRLAPLTDVVRPEMLNWDAKGPVPSDIPNATLEDLVAQFEKSF